MLKNILGFHNLLLALVLVLFTFLGFWALETDGCVEIEGDPLRFRAGVCNLSCRVSDF